VGARGERLAAAVAPEEGGVTRLAEAIRHLEAVLGDLRAVMAGQHGVKHCPHCGKLLVIEGRIKCPRCRRIMGGNSGTW